MAFFDRFKGDKKNEHDGHDHKPAKKEAKVSVSEKPAAPKVEPPKDSTAYRVLMHPLVSEKTSRLESIGQYVFAVSRHANKVEIKKAVERHYKVHVTGVNVVNVSGKTVRFGRTEGRTSDWRKAYVSLKKGETLAY
jgi:large subunit ribosomal protein L23